MAGKQNTLAVQDFYKCTPCNTPPLDRVAYIAHILGKRHQKNLKSRNLPQANDEATRTIHVTESSDVAKKVLAKNHYLGGTRLHVSARHRKNHRQDTVNRAIPISRNLSNMLSEKVKGRQLDSVIYNLVYEIQLKAEDYQKREFLRKSIVQFLMPHFPHVFGYVFGSSANNLGFVGCDVDLYVDLGVNPWAEGYSKAETECKASDLTWYLAREIRRSRRGTMVQAVARARVPIVKFQDIQTGLMVDLSFRHGMPVYNTQLICQYSCTHPLVRPYLMLIRYWAKIQGVAGGGQPSFLITNYALTMLMLFYLMTREDPIIPSVAYLKRNQGVNHRGIVIGGWNCTFDQDVSEWNLKRHSVSVMELVTEFFTYYGNLEASKWIISPLAGELVDKTAIKNRELKKLPPCFEWYCRQKTNLQIDTSLCLQDPFEHSHNCTRGLRSGPLAEFQYKCKRAAAICSNVVKGEQSLSDFLCIIEITPDILKELCSADSPKELDQTVEEVITLDDSDDASQDSVEILDVSSAKAPSAKAVPSTELNSSVKMDDTKSEGISDEEEIIVVISGDSREVCGKNLKNGASSMEVSENGVDDSSADCHELPLMLPESVPEKKLYKFLLHFSGIPEFNITFDGAVSGGKGVMIAEDDIGQAACSLVHFALQQCLKIDVSVIEAFLGERKRKTLSHNDIETGKRIKGADGESVLVVRKYRRLAQYHCLAAVQLWIGRKKISKSVPMGKNVTPLQHELAITEVQVSAAGVTINSDSLANSEKLDFLIELWQKCSDPTNILVTGDSRSSVKITRAQMIPMFCYLTSLSQSLLKKLTNFVITTSSKR
ncbi:uncharacterized protein [Panulirus ornatus]|uniref:uncharacterized protein n=1 Tax=Panulirus ornatus TaxID=150431 RepID=UPI003A8736C9